jgi:hypothetical protein
MAEYNFTVLFEPAEEGDTLQEARAMAQDAIRGTLRACKRITCQFRPIGRSRKRFAFLKHPEEPTLRVALASIVRQTGYTTEEFAELL